MTATKAEIVNLKQNKYKNLNGAQITKLTFWLQGDFRHSQNYSMLKRVNNIKSEGIFWIKVTEKLNRNVQKEGRIPCHFQSFLLQLIFELNFPFIGIINTLHRVRANEN